jgi:hypothetical protein
MTRFDMDMDGSMEPSEHGQWVLYEDVQPQQEQPEQEEEVCSRCGSYAHERDALDKTEREIERLQALLTKQEQGEPDWKALVLNHNAECESRCNMDSCGYKPYFEYSKRRCPNCPVHEMIDVEYTTPYVPEGRQPAQKPWVGLTDEQMMNCLDAADQMYCERDGDKELFKGRAIEAKLREKNSL